MFHIIDDYYCDTDNLNYILIKKHTVTEEEVARSRSGKKNVGDIEWLNISYHGNLVGVLKKIISLEQRKIRAKTINEYIDKLVEVNEKLEKGLKEVSNDRRL